MTDLVLTPNGLRAFGRTLPCAIGRGGVRAVKREGDGATPAGAHRVVAMLHRPDRVRPPAAWSRAIGPPDLWCDDPASPAYNRRVRAPFAASAERLRRADPLYDVVIVLDWNMAPAVPGRGSAIFVHRWRRPGAPTEGCVALDPRDLAWLAARVRPGDRLVVPT